MEMTRSIFRFLMEGGYYPTYEKTHILFELDDNPAILEYAKGKMTVRIFFTIEEDTYNIFLEASNTTMSGTFNIKPVILDDRRTLMFSCETMCDNMREFKKFFPRSLEYIKDALILHRHEMKELLQKSMLNKDLYTHDNEYQTSKKFCS
jgi:hypothetical protein